MEKVVTQKPRVAKAAPGGYRRVRSVRTPIGPVTFMIEDELDNPQFAVDMHVVYEAYGTYAVTRAWQPMVNVYDYADRMEVCVELAGMDQRAIDVHVEPGRLVIRGTRAAPEPMEEHAEDAPMRIVCMEIDYGSFERVMALSDRIAVDQVHSTYHQGLLWVILPYRVP